jgi:hypothetical protein
MNSTARLNPHSQSARHHRKWNKVYMV